MKMVKWLMAGAAVAALACNVDAQGRGGAGGAQGQGRGQGGMTGMMGGGGGSPTTLVANKAVQEEVKMTDEQKTKLEEWAKDAGAKSREKLMAIPRDEMREKMPAMMAEIAKEQWKDVEGVLKSEQVSRLRQISVQAMGIRAFSNKDVTDKLKLTEDQTSKVKGILDDLQKETRDMFGGGAGGGGRPDPDKMAENMKKMTELTKKTMEKVKESLTDDQKKTWTEMVGKEFDTAKLQVRPMRRDQ